jgi:hypothetical protein
MRRERLRASPSTGQSGLAVYGQYGWFPPEIFTCPVHFTSIWFVVLQAICRDFSELISDHRPLKTVDALMTGISVPGHCHWIGGPMDGPYPKQKSYYAGATILAPYRSEMCKCVNV